MQAGLKRRENTPTGESIKDADHEVTRGWGGSQRAGWIACEQSGAGRGSGGDMEEKEGQQIRI